MRERRLLSLVGVAFALLLSTASAPARSPQQIAGRPWTSQIPDPDKFDWTSNNRPGYHFAGMSPNQQKFYDYIQAKRKAGQTLSFAEESMIRRLTTLRAWPEAPRPNEFWKSFMRYLRERPTRDLNIAQRIMLSQLFARGISGFDNPGNAATERLAQYLNSKPFEARNWFERTFGRVEPWIKYEYQAMSFAPSGPAPGNVFPPEGAFNGMQITYNVSGATLGAVKDAGGFTTTRTIEGTFGTGGSLDVSGKVSVGGYGATLTVYVFAGSQNKSYKVWIENKKDANTGSFNISVPVPKDAESAGFSIREDGSYSMGGGSRGLVVSASLTLNAGEKAAKQAAADAEWRQRVEQTLKMLGYQQTPEGQEVEALRQALSGGDAAWKKYVDDQQKKLGYDDSPDARAYRELADSVDQGGEPFNAYVRSTLGNKAPAWAQEALPDMGGIEVGTNASNGNLQDVGNTISSTPILSTVYRFKDLAPDTVLQAVWSRDGVEVNGSSQKAKGTGWASFGIRAGSGNLKPGRYTVTITANGSLVARKTVTVT